MANREMIYDFQTVLEKIISSQQDMINILTLWNQMLDSTPRIVEFTLSDGSVLRTPNIQMIVSTINERTLPAEASFTKVSATGVGGAGSFTNGGIKFEGDGVRSTYGALGMEGGVWAVRNNATIRQWPIPRYWSLAYNGQLSLTIAPAIPVADMDSMGDFFVFIGDSSRSAELTFASYGQNQVMLLNCPSGMSTAVWHVVVHVSNRSGSGGLRCTAKAVLMDKEN